MVGDVFAEQPFQVAAAGPATNKKPRIRISLVKSREGLSGRHDAEVTLAARSGDAFHSDLNVPAKQRQEMHEALG